MSTSKLQQLVKTELKNYNRQFIENYRPRWLTDEKGCRLELDFFLENQKIAIEVQGEQHFIYTPFFHKSQDDFLLQRKRDIIKKELCQARGIYLIEITSEEQIINTVLRIMGIEHKPEALNKILKYNKNAKIIKSLAPNEACLYHAQEIKKYQSRLSGLHKVRNKNPATAKAYKSTLGQIKQHKKQLIKMIILDEAKDLAIRLLKQLFRKNERPQEAR